jgi:hypothetical protein
MRRQTVRILEIVEILRVTHQRMSVIVRQPGFRAPAARAELIHVLRLPDFERADAMAPTGVTPRLGPSGSS